MFGKKKIDFYDAEEIRIQEAIAKLDPCTPEYKEMLGVLKMSNNNREESKESKRRIAKADRGGIIGKIIGTLCLTGSVLGICLFEKEGNTFTGEKRSWVDTIIGSIGRFRFW